MADKPHTPDAKASTDPAAPTSSTGNSSTPSVPPKRTPGHRGADVRDTVAEMAAKAQEISQEAGSKMAAAMRDVISAAAGMASFAADSARDLVQYMVRRGQMTQEEADKLIREAEEAAGKRNVNLPPPPSKLPKPPVQPTPVATPVVRPAPEIKAPPKPAIAAPAPPPPPLAAAKPAPAKKAAPAPVQAAKPPALPVAKGKAPAKPAVAKKKSAKKR